MIKKTKQHIFVPQEKMLSVVCCDGCGANEVLDEVYKGAKDWSMFRYDGESYDFCPKCSEWVMKTLRETK